MITDNPKVSVIVPLYNYEQYVEKAVKSLMEQTYKNIEIIVVDDGSTDKSGEIVDKLAEEDDRIKVTHQKNGGIGKAIKTGLSMATGDYIAFLDSDDWMEPNAYEVLAKIAIQSQADIVEFGTDTFDTEGHLIDKIVLKNEDIVGTENILNRYFFVGKLPHLSSKFVKSNLFDGCVFFERSVSIDEITTIQLLLKTNKITRISDCFYNCLRGKHSVSKDVFWGLKLKEVFLSNADILKLLQNLNVKCLSFYAIDVLKKYSVMYYKVKKEDFAKNCDVDNIDQVLIKEYKENYKYVDWEEAKLHYSKSDILGLKCFKLSPRLFCCLYSFKRKKS